MRNLGKVLLVMTLAVQSLWSDGVEAIVSSTEIVNGNPVQLQIKATGDDAQFPDIQMIDGHSVVGTNSGSSSSYSYINGKMKSQYTTTKTYTFIPNQNVSIPSYEVKIDGKIYKTQPIEIKMVKSNATVGQSNDIFSLQMRANKTKVMVGESLMVTVYFSLKNGVRLSHDIQYTAPNFSGFIVTEGGDQNAYIKGNYQVQEVRYILTPQEEGNFTVTPAHAKVGVADRSRRDIFGMTFGTEWKQMASNTLEIEVLPQAKESDLVGDFTVDVTIDAEEVKANKPVNLTVKIEGKGNLESFEFPKYEIDGVTVYSDEAKVETKVLDGQLYSTYSKSFAFISEDDFKIPARSFSMLAPEDQQMKELNVNAYEVTIKKSSTSASLSLKPHTNGMVQTKIAQPLSSQEASKEERVEVKTVAWWMLVASFGLGALSIIVLQRLPRLKSRRANPYKESEALKILYAHMSEDTEVEEMVRKLYARKNGDKTVEIDKKVLKEMVERFR
ncbi:BatD family protein [Sulfurovum sp.]|uniref:BatD family protein n=1 Tax=Sulfurovum sp. TaxID=1969726 RepID=UPI00356569B2